VKGQLSGRNGAGPGHAQRSIYSKRLSKGRTSMAWMPIGRYYMDVHVDATWRIRLNRPCAVAVRPRVKLLRLLVSFISSVR